MTEFIFATSLLIPDQLFICHQYHLSMCFNTHVHNNGTEPFFYTNKLTSSGFKCFFNNPSIHHLPPLTELILIFYVCVRFYLVRVFSCKRQRVSVWGMLERGLHKHMEPCIHVHWHIWSNHPRALCKSDWESTLSHMQGGRPWVGVSACVPVCLRVPALCFVH